MSDGTPDDPCNSEIDEWYFQKDEKFKNRSPLVVKVKIYDGTDLIRDHSRDIRKSKNKDWLINAMMWALQNGKRVEIQRKES